MRVLVACEYSGRVRDEFVRRGHDATSCDLLPCDVPWGKHYRGDVNTLLRYEEWDMLIAFPPCTHLAVSGARWWPAKQQDGRQAAALEFVARLMLADIPKIAIENPVGIISTAIRKPDQYIQPWQHGHGETKKTGLWLKGLPLLAPSNIVEGREPRIHRMAPGPGRAKARSLTYMGIARAMAEQWG